MASREGINPLRPYYIPPSLALDPSASSSASAPSDLPASTSAQVFSNSARDLLPDLDYSDYLDSSSSASDWVRDALNRGVWRYTSVLTAQPFDVAKTILQAYVMPDPQEDDNSKFSAHSIPRRDSGLYGAEEDDYYEEPLSSDDESTYFTSAAPPASASDPPRSRRSRYEITDRSGYIPSSTTPPRHALTIKNPTSLMEVLSQLWASSGPTSLWKASNATFIYSLLLPTLNTFIRSLLSAIVGLPEEEIASSMTADILASTSPMATMLLSFISSSLAALILSPIDTARTFLILTPATHGPRSLLRAIRLLPTRSSTVPPHLVPITVMHSSLPNFILTTTPFFLKSYLSIDPIINPSLWSLFTFVGSGLELAVRFPLETVLRRAQIASYTSPSLRQQITGVAPQHPSSFPPAADQQSPEAIETIVPTPQTYRGVVATIWGVIYEEGVSGPPPESERARQLLGKPVLQRKRQGQGIRGLYRGWRIGMWGIAGIWGAGILGAAGGNGDEEVMVSGGQF